jgi:hypothetical protein
MARPSINKYFIDVLGVTPRNSNWSWGAVDEANRRVFLRVWNDHFVSEDNVEYMQVDWDFDPNYRSAGINERRRHIELIKSGYEGYGVVCEPVFDREGGRHIGSFDEETLLRFGRIVPEEDGTVYAAIEELVPTYDVVTATSSDATIIRDLRTVIPGLSVQTTTQAVILARIGQGAFRRGLIEQWGSCAVTGCGVLAALKASHIKPWSHCDDSRERLDLNNGLLLIANLDALFDAGLIGFQDSGQMMVAALFPTREWKRLGLSSDMKLRKQPNRKMREYLAYHRELHGLGR